MVSFIGNGTDGTSGNRIKVGQLVIAVTGTAISLPQGVGYNGIVLTARGTNSANITVGPSGVNNTINGTGNGYILAPGASVGVATSQFNQIFINGTAGDIISYIGS